MNKDCWRGLINLRRSLYLGKRYCQDLSVYILVLLFYTDLCESNGLFSLFRLLSLFCCCSPQNDQDCFPRRRHALIYFLVQCVFIAFHAPSLTIICNFSLLSYFNYIFPYFFMYNAWLNLYFLMQVMCFVFIVLWYNKANIANNIVLEFLMVLLHISYYLISHKHTHSHPC